MPLTSTSGDLHVTWTKPTAGNPVISYTLQARKGTTGAFKPAKTGIAPKQADPQSWDFTRTELVTLFGSVAKGDVHQWQVVALTALGSPYDKARTGDSESDIATTTVPW